MAITGNSSYIPTLNEFIPHWADCNTALDPQALLIRLPDNTTRTQAQLTTMRDALQAQQDQVQACLAAQQIARGSIGLSKVVLLTQFNMFVSLLDGYYQNTEFYPARPYAPSLTDGQEVFTRQLVDMMMLWQKLNAGPAPAGITLPLLLADGTARDPFASAVSSLQFYYATERVKAQDLSLTRARRNRMQQTAYDVMKSYREAVPGKLAEFPELVETLPRLTPLPGHTPLPVNASAYFQAPNAARVVYDVSEDPMLERYELRGTVGEHYDEADAVVIASHTPAQPREFITTFGLNQPGAQVALKVFVILTTGNEAGSATLPVERPVSIELLAA